MSTNETPKNRIKVRRFDLSLSIDEFLEKKFPHRPMILAPWLKQGTISMVYADRGLGKTWFSLTVAIAVTRGLPIGPWRTVNPVGCLYLDGEMAREDLQSRLRQLLAGLPSGQAPFHILSSEELKANNKPTIDLVDEAWRNKILSDLEHDESIRLLIIDNISCLAPRISENSKIPWDDINQWLLELRAIGVAVILVHHTGKNGAQRGTSAREDNIDISIKLSRIDEDPDFRGATFGIGFTKSRGLCGDDAAPFILRIAEGYAGRLPWEILSNE